MLDFFIQNILLKLSHISLKKKERKKNFIPLRKKDFPIDFRYANKDRHLRLIDFFFELDSTR